MEPLARILIAHVTNVRDDFTSAGATHSPISAHSMVSPSGPNTAQLTYAVETSIKVSERHRWHVTRPDYRRSVAGNNRVGSHATVPFNLLVPSAIDSEETTFTIETSIKATLYFGS